jgi:hypothetical protein
MKTLSGHTPQGATGGKAGRECDKPTWKRQEERIAKRRGGKLQPRSGAGPIKKGDTIDAVAVIEAKSTKNASISISVDHLKRVTDAAVAAHLSPAMSYTFENMPPGVDPDWVLIPMHVFNALTDTPEPDEKDR